MLLTGSSSGIDGNWGLVAARLTAPGSGCDIDLADLGMEDGRPRPMLEWVVWLLPPRFIVLPRFKLSPGRGGNGLFLTNMRGIATKLIDLQE